MAIKLPESAFFLLEETAVNRYFSVIDGHFRRVPPARDAD